MLIKDRALFQTARADPASPPTIAMVRRLERRAVRRGVMIALLVIGVILGCSTVYRAAVSPRHRTDFTVYTAAGQAVLDGSNIYDAENARGWLYMYLPIFAILVVPLAPLPVGVSAGIWYLLSVLMLGHMLWMSAQLARRFWPQSQWAVFWLAIWALLGILWPAMSGMARGQASVLLAWLVTLCLWAWFQHRPWLAGAGLAGAIVLKVFPGLLLVYFLFKRQWMMLLTTGVWLLVMIVLIPSLVFGPRGNYQLLHRWVSTIALPANQPGASERDPRYAQMADPRLERNQSVPAVAMRLIAPDDEVADATGSEQAAEWVGRIISLLLLLATAAVCWPGRGTTDQAQTLVQCVLVVLLMLFISPVSWAHSFALLALPLALIVAVSAVSHAPRRAAVHNRVYIAFLVLVLSGALIKPLQEAGVLMWATMLLWGLLVWESRHVHNPAVS